MYLVHKEGTCVVNAGWWLAWLAKVTQDQDESFSSPSLQHTQLLQGHWEPTTIWAEALKCLAPVLSSIRPAEEMATQSANHKGFLQSEPWRQAHSLLGTFPSEQEISAVSPSPYKPDKESGPGPSRPEGGGKQAPRVPLRPQPSPPDLWLVKRGGVAGANSAQPVRWRAAPVARLRFSYLLSFRVSAKIWRHGIHSQQLRASQLSMRQCLAAFGHRPQLPLSWAAEPEEEGGGRGGRRKEGAWRGGSFRAPASLLRDPRFSMGFPICGRDLPGVLRRRLEHGQRSGGPKQPRAPLEKKKKREQENHTQRRLNRSSELNIYTYIYL